MEININNAMQAANDLHIALCLPEKRTNHINTLDGLVPHAAIVQKILPLIDQQDENTGKNLTTFLKMKRRRDGFFDTLEGPKSYIMISKITKEILTKYQLI